MPGLVAACLAAEACLWFPNYLTYFNGLVRPAQAFRHVIDSSLDWGQDLPALRRYIDKRISPERPYLAFFGSGSPTYYGITANQIFGYVGFERAANPSIRILSNVAPDSENPEIAHFFRTHPDYDPAIVARVDFDHSVGTLVLKRADIMRLSGGTYLVSASLLQPVYYRPPGPWTDQHEAVYQQLKNVVRPILSSDNTERMAALEQRSALLWAKAIDEYEEYRFARLTAFLRKRDPDDTINNSILVFRLRDADLSRAVDGPPP
jgi:hypothetical protein